MNGVLSILFVLLGLVLIVGGLFWILRLFLEEDEDVWTDDDKRLIKVGCFGQYESEWAVFFRALMAMIVGIVFIVTGILI